MVGSGIQALKTLWRTVEDIGLLSLVTLSMNVFLLLADDSRRCDTEVFQH